MLKIQKNKYIRKELSLNTMHQVKKFWLNSKYFKIKQNHKFESKFFGFFQVLYLIIIYAYKIFTKEKIYNIFYIL